MIFNFFKKLLFKHFEMLLSYTNPLVIKRDLRYSLYIISLLVFFVLILNLFLI